MKTFRENSNESVCSALYTHLSAQRSLCVKVSSVQKISIHLVSLNQHEVLLQKRLESNKRFHRTPGTKQPHIYTVCSAFHCKAKHQPLNLDCQQASTSAFAFHKRIKVDCVTVWGKRECFAYSCKHCPSAVVDPEFLLEWRLNQKFYFFLKLWIYYCAQNTQSLEWQMRGSSAVCSW